MRPSFVERMLTGAGTCHPFEVLEDRRLLAFYEEVTRIPLTENPERMALADFNGDGRSDVVTVDDTGRVEVTLSGVTAGTFRRAAVVAFPAFVADIDTPDWTGDGRPDIVATSYNDRDLYIAAGNADGTFSAPELLDGNLGAALVTFRYSVFADFNADGMLDVAITDPARMRVEIALRTGAATLGPFQLVGTGGDARDIAAGDLDGDGDIDLVAANRTSQTITIVRNDGTGIFGNTFNRGVPAPPTRVAVGDLTGDGRADIVTANSAASGSVTIFRSVVAGAGLLDIEVLQQQAISNATGVVIGDIDTDGDADVVVSAQGRPAVLRNNGNFGSASREDLTLDIGLNGGVDTRDIALGNADNQPGLDLFGIDHFDKMVIVGFNYGNGVFAGTAVGAPVGATLNPTEILQGDVDGDGDTDLVVFTPSSAAATASLLRNLGGFFGVAVEYSLGSGANALTQIAFTDFNHDGFADLLGLDSITDNIVARLGSATGLFGPQYVALDLPGNAFDASSRFAVGSLPGANAHFDFLVDLVFNVDTTGVVGVAVNLGSGMFGQPSGYGTGSPAGEVQIADMDGNGAPDFVYSITPGQIGILFRGVPGATPTVISVPVTIRRFMLAQVEGDAKPDIVATGGTTVVVRNQSTPGVPSFVVSQTVALGISQPNSLSAADIDADGDQDFIVGIGINTLLLRNEGGTLVYAQQFSGNNPGFAILARVDANASPDLLTLNNNPRSVDIAFNAGNGRFPGRKFLLPAAPGALRVFSRDLDGDGFVEVVTVNGPGAVADTLAIAREYSAGFRVSVTRDAGTAQVRDAALEDFTGDGLPDLLLLDVDNTVRRLVLHAGTGSATTYFAAPQIVYSADNFIPAFASMTVGQVDGVAGLDVILAQPDADMFWVIRNLGGGQFGFLSQTATGDGPDRIALADFNGDGDLDAAASNVLSNTITIHANNGGGLGLGFFAPADSGTTFSTGLSFGPANIAAADLSNDGRPDIVLVGIAGVQGVDQYSAVSILLNTRTQADPISLAAQPVIRTGDLGGAMGLRIRDINSDGRPDILTSDNDTLVILEHDGTPTFPTISLYQLTTMLDFDTFAGRGDTTAEIVGVGGSLDNFASIMHSFPRHALTLVSTLVPENAPTLAVTIRFANSRLIDLPSIGTGDLKLYSTNGYFAPGTLVGTPVIQADNSVLASFTFLAPSEDAFQPVGYWDASDNGTFYLELDTNAVRQNNQQALPPQLVRTYNLFFNTPTANLVSATFADGGTSWDVTVRYTDHVGANRGISWDSVTNNDVQLNGPAGYSPLGTLVTRSADAGTGQLTATYRFPARQSPGGSNWWDNHDIGTYHITVRAGEVIENTGFAVAPLTLRTYPTLVFTTPGVEIVSGRVVNGAAGDSLEVTVSFTDTTPSMSYDSVDSGDFELYAEGILNYTSVGHLVSKSILFGGRMTAVYGFPAREGFVNANLPRFWDATDNGSYFLRARLNQVFDANGVPVPVVNIIPAGRVDSFGLFFDAPSAELVSFNPQAGQASTDITVRIATAGPLNLATIGDGDFRLIGPGGFDQSLPYVASSLVLEFSTGGTFRYLLRYRVAAPGGTWNNADNGNYTLISNPAAFSDQAGRANVERTLWSNFLFFV